MTLKYNSFYYFMSVSLIVLCFISFSELTNATSGNAEIEFEAIETPSIPLDPENPSTEVDLEKIPVSTQGMLRFDVLPDLNFGAQEISNQDQEYFVNSEFLADGTPKPNYIQITDERGALSGWEISVKQETPFMNQKAQHTILKGATLSFDHQTIVSNMDHVYAPILNKDTIKIEDVGTTYSVAKASKGNGSGTWLIRFGTGLETSDGNSTLIATKESLNGHPVFKNSAIQLFVPGDTPKDPVQYKTVLTWTLSET